MSLNFLATRFQCILALGHARHALRRPHRLRLRRSRTASACSATRGTRRVARRLDRADHHRSCAQDLNAGGSKFCGDCPLKLPLKKDEHAAGAAARRRPAAVADVHRVHGGLQHLVHRGVLRAGNRHHADAPGRHARLRAVPARHRRGRPVARPHRLLQLRRGVPAQARGRDVRVHQATLPAHLPLHEHQRPGVDRGAGAAAGALGHRRGDVLDRRRDARRATRKYRQRGRFDVAIANLRAMADEKRARGPRPAVPQLALHPVQVERQRRGDGRWRGGWPPRSASIACAGRSPITPRTRTRGGSCPGSPDLDAIRHEIWDDNNLGNAIPGATPRARIDVRTLVPGAAAHRAAPAGRCTSGRACTTCRRAPFPAQATYGRRLVRLGAQLCAADGTLINRDFARAWLPRHARPGGDRRRRRSRSRRSPSRGATRSSSIWSAKGSTGSSAAARETTIKTLWVR